MMTMNRFDLRSADPTFESATRSLKNKNIVEITHTYDEPILEHLLGFGVIAKKKPSDDDDDDDGMDDEVDDDKNEKSVPRQGQKYRLKKVQVVNSDQEARNLGTFRCLLCSQLDKDEEIEKAAENATLTNDDDDDADDDSTSSSSSSSEYENNHNNINKIFPPLNKNNAKSRFICNPPHGFDTQTALSHLRSAHLLSHEKNITVTRKEQQAKPVTSILVPDEFRENGAALLLHVYVTAEAGRLRSDELTNLLFSKKKKGNSNKNFNDSRGVFWDTESGLFEDNASPQEQQSVRDALRKQYYSFRRDREEEDKYLRRSEAGRALLAKEAGTTMKKFVRDQESHSFNCLSRQSTDYRLLLLCSTHTKLSDLRQTIYEIWFQSAEMVDEDDDDKNNYNLRQRKPRFVGPPEPLTAGNWASPFNFLGNEIYRNNVSTLINDVGDSVGMVQNQPLHTESLCYSSSYQVPTEIQIDVVGRFDSKSTFGSRVVPVMRNWKFVCPENIFARDLSVEWMNSPMNFGLKSVISCHFSPEDEKSNENGIHEDGTIVIKNVEGKVNLDVVCVDRVRRSLAKHGVPFPRRKKFGRDIDHLHPRLFIKFQMPREDYENYYSKNLDTSDDDENPPRNVVRAQKKKTATTKQKKSAKNNNNKKAKKENKTSASSTKKKPVAATKKKSKTVRKAKKAAVMKKPAPKKTSKKSPKQETVSRKNKSKAKASPSSKKSTKTRGKK